MGICRKAATPAKKNLFEIEEDSTLLSSEEKEAFHHTVDQLMYLSTRCRNDLLLAVSFLSTRV